MLVRTSHLAEEPEGRLCQHLEDLKAIPFRNIGGRPVTLGDVATFYVVEKPEQIERELP